MNTEESKTTKKDENTEGNTCGCTGKGVCAEGDVLVEEDRDVINDVRSIFDDPDCAYPLNDVMEKLRALGYENPGGVVTLALQDEAIYVDSVENSGTVYLALTEQDEEE